MESLLSSLLLCFNYKMVFVQYVNNQNPEIKDYLLTTITKQVRLEVYFVLLVMLVLGFYKIRLKC